LDAYAAHADEPYCKSCYGKLFGPTGIRGGSISKGVASSDSSDTTPEKSGSFVIDSDSGGGVKAALSKLRAHLSEEDKKKLDSK
jgi:hypothetical protein